MKTILLSKVMVAVACAAACGWCGVANGQGLGNSMGPDANAYTGWSVKYTALTNVVSHDIDGKFNPILAEAKAEKKSGD